MLDSIGIRDLAIWLFVSLIAITFHEAAHAFVAKMRGDDTAFMAGRMTFNPLAHMDPFGTAFLPALMLLSGMPFMFGWAKPVPVSFNRLRSRLDIVLVAAAGPGINLALAIASALVLRLSLSLDWLPGPTVRLLGDVMTISFFLNIGFAVFNLLPLPPLDGYRLLSAILPKALTIYLARIETYGLVMVLGLLFILPWVAGRMGVEFDPMGVLLVQPVAWLAEVISSLVGIRLEM